MAPSSRRPARPSDLVDVEAPPPPRGRRVETSSYAIPPDDGGDAATPEDLVDVEAPPGGGAAVDTAAYAAPGRNGRAKSRAKAAEGAAETPSAAAPSAPGVQAKTPPAASAGGDGGGDLLDGAAGRAPLSAGPDLGGGPASGGAEVGEPETPGDGDDLLQLAAYAALRLAADRPWPEVTLRDVAREAGVPFAALYARAPGRRALLLALSAHLDRAALEQLEAEDAPAARDRLFEAFMSRLEVMAAHRDALLAVGRSEGVALAAALPRTARALAEGAGVDTSGARGALRLAALTAAWARTLQVWRDDEGALNRTMAEIDKLLSQADGRLARVGAGF